MSIINLNKGNCQHCYKCIRQCPLKSISFKDNSVSVIKEECILCGTCVECCPQNARFTRNDTPRIKELIAGDKPVYVTLAPAWESYFDGISFEEMSAALKSLGFAGVEETAIGAAEVSREYAALAKAGEMANIITTACPSVVMLVEQRFPQLIPMLAPVLSPMVAHAKLMRKAYGSIAVVFIGPCLAKMHEAEDVLTGNLVDCALTFTSLSQWLAEASKEGTVPDIAAKGVTKPVARLYPKPTGILKTIATADFGSYKQMAVDGVEACIELMQWIDDMGPTGMFIEANICKGACLGGPAMRMDMRSPYTGMLKIDGQSQPQDQKPADTTALELSYNRLFANRKPKYEKPTQVQIEEVLHKIGKHNPEQELNCGSCGYLTCRDKAEAVIMGKADINMCLPFLREQSEKLSNTMIENSPNGIIALDSEMNVIDINPRAEDIFGICKKDAQGQMLPEFYCEDSFENAKEAGIAITKTGIITTKNIEIEQTVVYIKESSTYVVFAKDITANQEQKRLLEEMRLNTVGVAQKVIDKQMRVAQEIASLLGETTAETKVALTKLKKSISQDL